MRRWCPEVILCIRAEAKFCERRSRNAARCILEHIRRRTAYQNGKQLTMAIVISFDLRVYVCTKHFVSNSDIILATFISFVFFMGVSRKLSQRVVHIFKTAYRLSTAIYQELRWNLIFCSNRRWRWGWLHQTFFLVPSEGILMVCLQAIATSKNKWRRPLQFLQLILKDWNSRSK